MTAHPIDTEALRREARRVISDPYGGALETWWASHALRALDALAAAEHRADEAEGQIKAVLDMCDDAEDPDQWPPRPIMHGGEPFPESLMVHDIRRALTA